MQSFAANKKEFYTSVYMKLNLHSEYLAAIHYFLECIVAYFAKTIYIECVYTLCEHSMYVCSNIQRTENFLRPALRKVTKLIDTRLVEHPLFLLHDK